MRLPEEHIMGSGPFSLFVPRERARGERRVAASPDAVGRWVDAGRPVLVETGAGVAAGFDDVAYHEAGGTILDDGAAPDADVVVRVAAPDLDDVEAMRRGSALVALMAPHRNLEVVARLAERRISTLAMDLVPRITRAQSMDALSSQANVAGYRAVIEAAQVVDKYFPLFMTAAGTIRPARIVVLGAGVAGLQAVATAKRLGAIVHVSDIRDAARADVASLGGSFIEVPDESEPSEASADAGPSGPTFLERQRAVVTDHLAAAHAVITTAQIPGRAAPELITKAMVEAMQPGSVVIDLAAADGGNCALTSPDEVVEHGGVRIIPGSHLPSSMPGEASALYARNITAFVELLTGADGQLHLDRADDIVAGTLLTHDGVITLDRFTELLAARRTDGGDR
jgi:H+-translocating NAD(P) transhydrogenase subunit alpha